MSATNPPDSPPAQPVIPEGLATKMGKYGAPLVFVLALLADVTGVKLDTETAAGFAGSILMVVTMMWGRYKQAAALYTTAPPPAAIVDDDSGEEDLIDEDFDEAPTQIVPQTAPPESSLHQDFPEDPPVDPPTTGGKFGEPSK